MKCRIWMKVVLWVVLPLSVALAACFLVPGEGVDPLRIYRVRWIAKKLHLPLPPPTPLTAAEQAAAKADAVAWKAKFLAEFPALHVPERPVPDEENGFRLLYELGDTLPISAEFSEVLQNISSCDPKVAKRCLAEHAEQVAQAERIGTLTTRSSTGMPEDYIGFFSARSTKQCAEILLLKARFAAEAGDENETLRLVAASGNLADHLHDVEAPTLIGETVSILINLSRAKIAFSTLLPALGKSADLERWKAELSKRPYSTAELAKVIRGEWQTGADFMAFPVMAVCERLGELPDAEAAIQAYSSWTNEVVTKLPSLGLADMDSAAPLSAGTDNLSEEGRLFLEDWIIGLKPWTNGYARSTTVNAQTQAVLDLLILEKSGSQLVASDANRITRDPVSGQPFVFDPTKRELNAPTDSSDLGVEPLVLPW